MLNFEYNIPTRVYFGKGEVASLEHELKGRYKRVLIVTGSGSVKSNGVFDQVLAQVKKAGLDYKELSGIQPNPRLKSVYKGIQICRDNGIDLVLGIGGGSVIDASKTVAAGAEYDGDCWDFFINKASPERALGIGCVLTLAATGTEMNGNSVITREDTKRKLALCTPHIRPRFSILDPEYTFTVNRYHTAAGVVDIMAHIFEQYFSHTESCDVQDGIAKALLKVCVKYGPIVLESPRDYGARANIMWAGTLALNGLIGIGKEADWASHGIEHELSAIYDISHGAGLSIIIPNWMKHVLSSKTVSKIAAYGVNVWSIDGKKDPMDIADEAISRTKDFFTSLGMPQSLKEVGIPKDMFSQMACNAIDHYGQVGSFKKLNKQDIVDILNSAL
jgi:alcohol dehydrogenase YqhD (iron-dependent ADH family)